jgi:hypothetical protein
MEYAFYDCDSFTIKTVDTPNLVNVTNMSYMFSNASNFG